MKKTIFNVVLICVVWGVFLLPVEAYETNRVRWYGEHSIEYPEYPGLKSRKFFAIRSGFPAWGSELLFSTTPFYEQVMTFAQEEGFNSWNPPVHTDPNFPRPEKFNLTPHPSIKFLSEYARYPAQLLTKSGTLNSVFYRESRTYMVTEYIIPDEHADKVFVDGTVMGHLSHDCSSSPDDDGPGFIMVFLNDTELIYASKTTLYETSRPCWSCSATEKKGKNVGFVAGFNKGVKISVVTYVRSPKAYQEGVFLRRYPSLEDRRYKLDLKVDSSIKLGDNTKAEVAYDLTNNLVIRYVDPNRPMWEDLDARLKINNSGWIHSNNLTNLTNGYISEGEKDYVRIEVTFQRDDRLTGTVSQKLGYGYVERYDIPINVPKGVPVLQNLISQIQGLGVQKTPAVIVLSDDNRKWAINAQNKQLVSTLVNTLKANNFKLFLIGKFEQELFGPLLN